MDPKHNISKQSCINYIEKVPFIVIFLHNPYIFVWIQQGCLANRDFALSSNNSVKPKKKKKLSDSQTLFSKNICVRVAFYLYFYLWLGTFLDIWVCVAKQNGERKYLNSICLQV